MLKGVCGDDHQTAERVYWLPLNGVIISKAVSRRTMKPTMHSGGKVWYEWGLCLQEYGFARMGFGLPQSLMSIRFRYLASESVTSETRYRRDIVE